MPSGPGRTRPCWRHLASDERSLQVVGRRALHVYVDDAPDEILDAHAVGQAGVDGLKPRALPVQDAVISPRASLDRDRDDTPDLAVCSRQASFAVRPFRDARSAPAGPLAACRRESMPPACGALRVDESKHLPVTDPLDDVEGGERAPRSPQGKPMMISVESEMSGGMPVAGRGRDRGSARPYRAVHPRKMRSGRLQ